MRNKFLAAILLSLSFPLQADQVPEGFSNIKELLKSDKLEGKAKKKNASSIKEAARAQKLKIARYYTPDKEEIWPILSELWLVKNAQLLKWDFEKPDYGLNDAFKDLLESLGFYNLNFKILIMDSPLIPYASLPHSKDEKFFILSLPFIRTLDLTKLEISILLLQEMFRDRLGQLRKHLSTKEFEKNHNMNFYNKKFDIKVYYSVLEKISDKFLKKGFNFNDQFELTKKMDQFLKQNLVLWNAYHTLLKKIDKLIKTNKLFENYNKIYPSPEMQIAWLTNKK